MAEITDIAIGESLGANASELFEKYLDVKSENIPAPTRWKVVTTQLFRSFSSIYARLLVSKNFSDEVDAIYTYASYFVRRFKQWDRLEIERDLQDVFMLGFFYSLKGLYEKADEMGDDKQDKQLQYVLREYKHIGPCLDALNHHVRLSHSDLATQLKISPTALSNFMSRISEYHLFSSSVVGRKRYYSLSYPNGEKALSLAQASDEPEQNTSKSTLEVVLTCLSQIIKDEIDADSAVVKCRRMVTKQTPQTDLLAKQLQNIISALSSPRIRMPDLLDFESRVDKYVAVYTINIDRDKDANETVVNNLRNGKTYYYIVNETQGNKDKLKSQLHRCFMAIVGFEESLWDRIEIIVAKQDNDSCFLETSEIVIHDGKRVFVSKDTTVNRETLYTETEGERGQEIKNKILNLIPGFPY